MKLVEIGGEIYGAVNRAWYREATIVSAKRWPTRCTTRCGSKTAVLVTTRTTRSAASWGFRARTNSPHRSRCGSAYPPCRLRMTLTFRQVGENEWEMFTPQCGVPEAGEAGGPELMDYMVNKICGHLELFGFRHGAARWNPNIRIDPLKLPPRASADEPHCRWRHHTSRLSPSTTQPNRALSCESIISNATRTDRS